MGAGLEWLDQLLDGQEPQALPDEQLPTTYEEWVEIHGEPVDVAMSGPDSFISISEDEPEDRDAIYEDLKKEAFIQSEKGQVRIDDGIFAELYMKYNNIVFSNGAFYSPDGMISVGTVQQEVLETIEQGKTTDIARDTKKVVDALKIKAYRENFDFSEKKIIPFINGDMAINDKGNWTFVLGQKQPVPYRLPISFIPINSKRDTPNFDKWVKDLFAPEDIPTLQEYLGYCFLPTTRGQKSLVLIGDPEIGKSVIGVILKALFGKALTAPFDTQQFLNDKFKLPELENQLVFYEDDLTDKTFDETGVMKKLITNQLYLTADRKNEQPFKFKPFCRYIMCGNEMIKIKNDKSDGLPRRLLTLKLKPKDPTRKIDVNMGEKVEQEAIGIAQWALLGLKRLLDNDWEFTESKRAKAFKAAYMTLNNHFPAFMDDVVKLDNDAVFHTKDLVTAYKLWCKDNAFMPCADTTLMRWLAGNSDKYGLVASTNVMVNGVRRRGYKGGSISNDYARRFGHMFTL